MCAQRRKKSGQFASETSRDAFALYELVRVVAAKAAELVNAAAGAGAVPVLPAEVTMEAWDAAAAALVEDGVYKSVPPARTIGKLLPDLHGKPFSWRPLLELVFDERSIERVHMARRSGIDDRYIAERHVYYALNRVTQHLRKTTINRTEYMVTRESLLSADTRRRNGGHLADLLPTLGQIEFFISTRYQPKVLQMPRSTPPAFIAGVTPPDEVAAAAEPALDVDASWDLALEIAELDPRPEMPHITRESVPVLEAIVRFYEIVGFLPSEPKLQTFARDFNFALETVREKDWRDDVLAAAAAELKCRGLPEPPQYDPRRQKLEWTVPEMSPWPDDPPHRSKTIYTHAMVLTVVADFQDWLPRGQAASTPLYAQFSRDDPDKPSLSVINAHGGLDQLLDELARPDALEKAHRELNPTAAELEARERTQLEKKLRHPTPQAILRVITERGEASAREISEAVGVDKATVNNWLPLLMSANRIEPTTPSRVAKNVKYCLRGNAPTAEESQLRKLRAKAEGASCQAVLKLIVDRETMTAKELSEETGSRPEVVVKWLRPLKLLGLIEQVDDRTGGVKRTYYRPATTLEDAGREMRSENAGEASSGLVSFDAGGDRDGSDNSAASTAS